MKKSKIVLISVSSVVAFVFCVFSILGLLIYAGYSFLMWENEKEFEYIESANWNCESDTEFIEKYKSFYIENIDDILKKHRLKVEKIVEENKENGQFDLYYYNDVNTIHFHFCQASGFAFFKANYYFYQANGVDLQDYEAQRQYIDFFNGVIKLYAFDACGNDNTFKDLFDESISGKGYESYIYHFDSFCGNVGYSVGLKRNVDSYYYKIGKNSKIDILSNRFQFEGILKSQDI